VTSGCIESIFLERIAREVRPPMDSPTKNTNKMQKSLCLGTESSKSKMSPTLTIPNISEKLSPLGLDNNYKVTESAPKILGVQWNVKNGLKIYFLTIRLRVSISHEVVTELVTCLRTHKHYKQMLLRVEKENATGPCTHHVHAIVHFKTMYRNPGI